MAGKYLFQSSFGLLAGNKIKGLESKTEWWEGLGMTLPALSDMLAIITKSSNLTS